MISKNLSVFAGIVKFTDKHIETSMDFFSNHFGGNSFIAQSNDDTVFSKGFLNFVVNKCMENRSVSTLNYITLINLFCENSGLLIKLGGDYGVNYFSIQVFYSRDKYSLSYFIDMLNSTNAD